MITQTKGPLSPQQAQAYAQAQGALAAAFVSPPKAVKTSIAEAQPPVTSHQPVSLPTTTTASRGPDIANSPAMPPELSKLPSTSKISPTKLASRKLDIVSPQILSASDAMAAVSALQLSPSSVTESGGDKYNGEVMSDDTDNSLKTPLTFSEKAKFAKRKKRRMQESDGGEGSQQPLQCCSILNLISLQERRRMTWRIPRRTRDPRG